MRWVIQWIASERHAESRVPTAFWYMSMIGGLITLAYAIYRQDPVFIAGQSIGSVVYLRNLMLIHRPSQGARHGLPGDQIVMEPQMNGELLLCRHLRRSTAPFSRSRSCCCWRWPPCCSSSDSARSA